MSDDELTTLSFRLPTSLRDKIESQALAEQRSLSGFFRFHIGELVNATDEESNAGEEAAP